jgi:hypothetical protein
VTLSPIQDGVLVTGETPIKVSSGEWTVLVTLERPQTPSNLTDQIGELVTQVKQMSQHSRHIQGWILRLKRIQAQFKVPPIFEQELAIPRRPRRGLLNGVGIFAGWLLGLSTEGELNEVRNMVEDTRQKQKEIVHHLNSMTTVLNHTFSEIQKNRKSINKLSKTISEVIPRVNELITRYLGTSRDLKILRKTVEIDRILVILELATREFMDSQRNYARKRENLQLGRLTENLLPPRQLADFLRIATTNNLKPITPLYWYYRYTMVTNVQGGETLVYKITLPLVEIRNFLRYSLHSWESPFNTSGLTVSLKVDSDIALDSRTGECFHPTICSGNNPKVCKAGIRYSKHGVGPLRCSIGIVTGNLKIRNECIATLRESDGQPLIEQVAKGQFVITS